VRAQYTTRQKKIGRSKQLDLLAREAGIVYTRIVVLFWRIVRHHHHWLSKYSMQKLVRNSNLHSQTVQGITDMFYDSLTSWQKLRRINPDARPPNKLYRYHTIPFKESAIKLKDGKLVLSCGKGNAPVVIPWRFEKPKTCTISYNGKEYVLNAVYALEKPAATTATGYAGIDLGEVHPVVVDTGKRVIIVNGGELRSKRRYQNKAKGQFQRKMAKKKRGSRRWKRLNKAKKRVTQKLDNQINDILHKQSTKIVCAMKEDGVKTVGIGDMRDLRNHVDYGAKANQKIHQMPSGRVRSMITYKALRLGMTVELVDEAYSSQTCPKCGARNKTSTRNYECRSCGFRYHRDGVGAVNIRSKTMYTAYEPVVGDMTPPVGIRYKAASCTSAVLTA